MASSRVRGNPSKARERVNATWQYLCLYSAGDLQVEVVVLDVRTENARVQACTRPIAGRGRQWVDACQLEIWAVPTRSARVNQAAWN